MAARSVTEELASAVEAASGSLSSAQSLLREAVCNDAHNIIELIDGALALLERADARLNRATVAWHAAERQSHQRARLALIEG